MQKIQNFLIRLLPHDKLLHFFVGFILFIILNTIVSDIISLTIVLIIAFIKELRDEIIYGGFDIKDLLFTVLPAIIMVTIYK